MFDGTFLLSGMHHSMHAVESMALKRQCQALLVPAGETLVSSPQSGLYSY